MKELAHSAEHERLKSAVVEKARPFVNDDMDISNRKTAEHGLHKAVCDLRDFEAEHGLGKQGE